MPRTVYPHFQLSNPIYAGATVTLYTVDEDGEKTSTKATLYEGWTGSGELKNPQNLDSSGRFQRPVYIEQDVVATISGLTIPDHDTGTTALFASFDNDIGEFMVIADGGTTARTLRDHFGDFLHLKDFANLVDGDDWAPAINAGLAAAAGGSILVGEPGTRYTIRTRVFADKLDDWTFDGRGCEIFVPDIEGPESFARTVSIRECNEWAWLNTAFTSARTLDWDERTFGLFVMNSSDFTIQGNAFDGWTGRGYTVAQDVDRRETFDDHDSDDNIAITHTDYLDHLLVGLRGGERTLAASAIDTGNNQVVSARHGMKTGQLIRWQHSTALLANMPEVSDGTDTFRLPLGAYVFVERIDDDNYRIGYPIPGNPTGVTTLTFTDAGADGHEIRPRRRALIKDTDYTIVDNEVVFSGIDFDGWMVVLDVAMACNNRRIVENSFRNCGVNGLSEFPKTLSRFALIADNDFEDCGTEDEVFTAMKPGQLTEGAVVTRNRVIGGNNGMTLGNYVSILATDNQFQDCHNRGITIGVGDHGAHDDEDEFVDDTLTSEGIPTEGTYRLAMVTDNQFTRSPTFIPNQTGGAIRIQGSKRDGGEVVISGNISRRWSRGLECEARMPIPNIRYEGNKTYYPRTAMATVNASGGWAPYGMVFKGNDWIGDPSDPKSFTPVSKDAVLKGEFFKGVGTGTNMLALTSASGSTRIEDSTFEDCCPTSGGTTALVRERGLTGDVIHISGVRVRGASSKITHLARGAGSGKISIGVNYTSLPALVSDAYLLPAEDGGAVLALANLRISYGTAPPSTGTHAGAHLRINTAAGGGAPWAWLLGSDGTPGTWEPLYPGTSPLEDGDAATADAHAWYALSGGATLTLPASPTAGDRVIIVPKGDWESSNATIDRNGENIMGDASNLTLDVNHGFTVIYTGASFGWSLL